MRQFCRTVCSALAMLLSSPLAAADLSIRIVDQRGHPLPDAVVALSSADATPPDGTDAATYTIDQRGEQFDPYVQVFRPGDRVVFTNSDETRHHVYSFSQAKAFEFVLAAGKRSDPLTLERPGVIAVGCNIHDQMITFLYVSDAAWLGRSAADGSIAFTGLPAGHYTVRPWHPRMRPGRSAQPQSIELADGGSAKLTFQFPLMPDRRPPAAGDVSPY